MMVTHNADTTVEALIGRLEREGLLSRALNIRNKEHQVLNSL